MPPSRRHFLASAAALTLAPRLASAEAGNSRIDADFPGGNVRVESFDGETAVVAPDLRDTQKGQWWFYWNLRLRGPAGKRVTVTFAEKNPIGVRGPAESVDGGATWRHLGAAAVREGKRNGKPTWSFEARVPDGRDEVRYAFCVPYVESHLTAFLRKHAGNPALKAEELCKSRGGRSVELVRAGCLDPAKAKGVVLLTSRHHACEAIATYVIEGVLAAAIGDDPLGKRWREAWEVVAVPFVDKDGVVAGDQGKNRAPHDHNRDYNPTQLYPEVTAIMKLGEALKPRVRAQLDVHCPTIRGDWNDCVYLVGAPGEAGDNQRAFMGRLEAVRTGPIKVRGRDVLAYGQAWNTAGNYRLGRSCGAWARETFAAAKLVGGMEVAYADALGCEVTADSARALGRDVAAALADHLGG